MLENAFNEDRPKDVGTRLHLLHGFRLSSLKQGNKQTELEPLPSPELPFCLFFDIDHLVLSLQGCLLPLSPLPSLSLVTLKRNY